MGRRSNKKKKKKKVSNRYNGKKISRGQGITTTTSITSPPHYRIGSSIDDDCLEFEILNRLPVKSLARFKTVSKRWCTLIQKDQQFIDLHLTRSKSRLSPRLFMVVPDQPHPPKISIDDSEYLDFWPYKEFHITAYFLFEEEEEEDNTKIKLVVDTVSKEVDSSSYNLISKPVNGLICLVDSRRKHVARVRNISTGEVSPWFQSSSMILVGEERVIFPNLNAFGFDPATNEHKLVCVFTILLAPHYFKSFVCGVLTIGHHNRWRRIKDIPPYLLNNYYVYVNGVIYWSNDTLDHWVWGGGHRGRYRPVCLVAFDVGSEKFRTITIPDFILDRPRVLNVYSRFKDNAQLFEVDGNLAMIVKLDNCMFNMYIYEDDDYKDKDEKIVGTSTSSSHKSGRWSEVSCITLLDNVMNNRPLEFHTFIGSDDKILVTLPYSDVEKKKKCFSIYCYNWKKGTWTEVDVSGLSFSDPQLCPWFSTTFSESLLYVNNHSAL